jgi:hypothetical protein
MIRPALVLSVLTSFVGSPDSLGASHFRGFRFGSTLEEISSRETAKFQRSVPSAIVYTDTLFGFGLMVAFHFSHDDDRLIMGSYTVECVGYEIDEILHHYLLVVDTLNEKYGRSLKDGTLWWNERSPYRGDPVNGFRFGDASFRNEWYGPGVQVTLSLSNELNTRGEIVYRIVFQPGREYDKEKDLLKL